MKLEEKCEYLSRCGECKIEDVLDCKKYYEYIAKERVGKFREAEGLDYLELTERYENGER